MADGGELNDCLGIMLHGYDEEQAEIIGDCLRGIAGRDVLVFGGAEEGRTVAEIIEGAPGGGFEPEGIGMLMFLGFDDRLIDAALRAFPRDLSRPIFCTLTENNVNWTVSHLMEHLLEEKRCWEQRKIDADASD